VASRVAVLKNCKSIPALFFVPKGGFVTTVLQKKSESKSSNAMDFEPTHLKV
jgi:hypothetical protein